MAFAVMIALICAPANFFVGQEAVQRRSDIFDGFDEPFPPWLAGCVCMAFPPLAAVGALLLIINNTQETEE